MAQMAHFAHLLTEPHFMRKQHDVVSIAAVTIITEDFFRRSFFFMLSSYVLKGFLNREYLVYQGSKTFFLTVIFCQFVHQVKQFQQFGIFVHPKKKYFGIFGHPKNCFGIFRDFNSILEFLDTLKELFWNFWTP